MGEFGGDGAETAEQVSLPACSPFTVLSNTNFKVVDLTRLGIKREYADPEADALTTRLNT